MDYYFYTNGIDTKEYNESLLNDILYNGDIKESLDKITITINKDGNSNEKN